VSFFYREDPYSTTQITQKQQQDFHRLIRPFPIIISLGGTEQLSLESPPVEYKRRTQLVCCSEKAVDANQTDDARNGRINR